MFKFKNLLNPLQKVETYDVFSDYLKSDTLPIYQETEAGLQPLHIGNVPRIIEQSEDANNVTITIKYPFIPLIREYKKDHQIQFNGTDIYLSKHKATEENLYSTDRYYTFCWAINYKLYSTSSIGRIW